MKIIFDTYALIEYLEGTKKGKIVNDYLENDEIITPFIVLLELSYKADKKGWDMNKVLSFIKVKSEIVGVNEKFVLRFGNVYNDFKKKKRDIGLADAIILTTGLLYDSKILTGDEHFKDLNETILLE